MNPFTGHPYYLLSDDYFEKKILSIASVTLFDGSSGERKTWICGLLQYLSMYGTGIAYTITTSISMR